MPISFNNFFNTAIFIGLFKIAPCPLHQAITCHLLQFLIHKVQEKAFVYLFPSTYNEDIYNQHLTQYGEVVANRGRDEYLSNFSDSFKITNNALASTMTLFLLKKIGWTALNKFVLFHCLFVVKFSLLQIVVKIIVFIIQRLQKKPVFFHSIHVPKPNLLAQKKGQKISELLKKLQKLHLLEEVEELQDACIDWVTITIPTHPIKEKNNPLHFWDVKTLENLFKNSLAVNCPNGCHKKLELEQAISTDLQDKIIKQLEKAYHKYELSHLRNKTE